MTKADENIPGRVFDLIGFLAHEACKSPFMAVLGHPVSHSRSPLIHNTALNHIGHAAKYFAIDVPENQRYLIPDIFRHKNFFGANITLPLKGYVKDLLDKPSEAVNLTGSCNTIWPCSDGILCGDNTDIPGFLGPVAPYLDLIKSGGSLLFGSGGAARAIIAAINSVSDMPVFVATRNRNSKDIMPRVNVVDYSNWPSIVHQVNLIVNCTPLGMYPNVDSSPVSQDQISCLTGKICYDIVYNPVKTKFLDQARKAGAVTIDGTEMFIGQAAQSFYHFTGKEFPVDLVRKVMFSQVLI
jgi:shikimate dehydrogenase